MKLSQIITKYEPLGWTFAYDDSLDGYWTFKSPRMKYRRGLKENKFGLSNPEEYEVSEDGLLAHERECYVRETYQTKILEKFGAIKEDIIRQMILVDEKNIPIPQEFNVSFDLNLK